MRFIMASCWIAWAALLVVLGMVACDFSPTIEPLTPFECRVTGVDVKNGDTVTGFVTGIRKYNSMAEVRAACQRPFERTSYGCVRPVGTNSYRVIYMWTPTPRYLPYKSHLNHELCHAYYEEFQHME